MSFLDKVKQDLAPHWERYKSATLPVQAGVAVGAVVAASLLVSMLPSLIFAALIVAGFYLVYTATTK